jgi:hypothetical protein
MGALIGDTRARSLTNREYGHGEPTKKKQFGGIFFYQISFFLNKFLTNSYAVLIERRYCKRQTQQCKLGRCCCKWDATMRLAEAPRCNTTCRYSFLRQNQTVMLQGRLCIRCKDDRWRFKLEGRRCKANHVNVSRMTDIDVSQRQVVARSIGVVAN